ncbi:MAG: ACT domain-containing protein [Rhizomicrobium sp.]
MSKIIHLELDRAEGSLPRIIGLIERRGFHIDGMTMDGEGTHRALSIHVRPHDASRRIDALSRQIDKLYGVRRNGTVPNEGVVSCAMQ